MAEYISKVIAIQIINKANILIANINKSYSFKYLKTYICRRNFIEKILKNIARFIPLIN